MFVQLIRENLNTPAVQTVYQAVGAEGEMGELVAACTQRAPERGPLILGSTLLSLFELAGRDSAAFADGLLEKLGELAPADGEKVGELLAAISSLGDCPRGEELLQKGQEILAIAGEVKEELLSGYGKKRVLDALLLSYDHALYGETVRALSAELAAMDKETFSAVVELSGEFPWL